MFDLWSVIITACFYMRVGILASLGFALQVGVGKGHFPQAAFSAVLYRAFQCLFHPTIISHALFCPQSSLILFSCAGSTGSLAASLWPLSLSLYWILLPSFSSNQFCLQFLGHNFSQCLSAIKWDSFYSVPGNIWTFRNVFTFFSWCFLKSAWESWKFPRGFQSK